MIHFACQETQLYSVAHKNRIGLACESAHLGCAWSLPTAKMLAFFCPNLIDKAAQFQYDSARCQVTGCEQSHAFSYELPRTTA